MAVKNWFGADEHPSDEYISWHDDTSPARVAAIRYAYDILHEFDPKALALIIELVKNKVQCDHADMDAGEAI
jgi:hypothetical protein